MYTFYDDAKQEHNDINKNNNNDNIEVHSRFYHWYY